MSREMDDCERLARFYFYNQKFIELWHEYVQHNSSIQSHPFPFNKDFRYLKLWLEEFKDDIAVEPYGQMVEIIDYIIDERDWMKEMEQRHGS